MNHNGLNGDVGSPARRPRADAAIVFGSAASAPRRKPDGVRATCEAIGLPRSTYYYQSHRSPAAIELEQKIVLRLHELRKCLPDDGYRKMTLHLQEEGFHVNRKRIARLMQLHRLSAKTAAKQPVSQRQNAVVSSNGQDITQITGPSQVWVTDITYARVGSNLVYVAAVIDAWSREVVGYAASMQITNRLVSIALHSAVRAHRPTPGCIHHSTCGSRYLTRSYCELLRQYGLVSSTSECARRLFCAAEAISDSASSRQIVDIQGHETWKDVIERAKDFIESLYCRERIDQILGLSPERRAVTNQ